MADVELVALTLLVFWLCLWMVTGLRALMGR
jgi:hypothetical protein